MAECNAQPIQSAHRNLILVRPTRAVPETADAIVDILLEAYFDSDEFTRFHEDSLQEWWCPKGHRHVHHSLALWPGYVIGHLVMRFAATPVHAHPGHLERLICVDVPATPNFDGDHREVIKQLTSFWRFLATAFPERSVKKTLAHLETMPPRFPLRPTVFPDACLQCDLGLPAPTPAKQQ